MPQMRGYYVGKLAGERLRRCYDVASPRVLQYLEAEVRFVLDRLRPGGRVLELGCGYGRVAFRLASVAGFVVGIDTAPDSVAEARRLAEPGSRCAFLVMDAVRPGFGDSVFDAVVCVQNGVCAFAVEQERLLREAVRVARPGGSVLFSSYAERFWPQRLAWFEAQAAQGLVGEIDRIATRNGTIVCKDGFRSGTMLPEAFRALAGGLGLEATLTEVDGSSVFCEIAVP